MSLTALLVDDIPLIDLRAPAEFAEGAFPAAVSLPLLMDAERREVGLVYARQGRDAAVVRGHELVSGAVRAERTSAWTEFITRHPNAWLYCWRGGLRSRIAQSWLREAGFAVPRVDGGYKSLRRKCLATLEAVTDDPKPWLVLGGRTGIGKTQVIAGLANSIDLEGLAHHRGSAFGARPGGQPMPIAFENSLAVAYLQHNASALVLEDEGRTIGRLALPAHWFERMRIAPLVLMEATIEIRIQNIRNEYVDEPLARGLPSEELQGRLAGALDRIRKRLGGHRHRQIGGALKRGFQSGDHEQWIELLLRWYYDPMYDYQLASKRERIIFRGDRSAVSQYLEAR